MLFRDGELCECGVGNDVGGGGAGWEGDEVSGVWEGGVVGGGCGFAGGDGVVGEEVEGWGVRASCLVKMLVFGQYAGQA